MMKMVRDMVGLAEWTAEDEALLRQLSLRRDSFEHARRSKLEKVVTGFLPHTPYIQRDEVIDGLISNANAVVSALTPFADGAT